MANAIIKPISKEEVAKAQIEGNLPDKPSQATLYGGKVLTPQEIKAWYDKLPKLIVDYYNNLIKAIPGIEEGKISDNSLAAQILTGIREGHSMKNLLEDITSGALADYLKVTGDISLTELTQAILTHINMWGEEAPTEDTEAAIGTIYALINNNRIKNIYICIGHDAEKTKWIEGYNGVPDVTNYDNGKVLMANNGQWEPADIFPMYDLVALGLSPINIDYEQTVTSSSSFSEFIKALGREEAIKIKFELKFGDRVRSMIEVIHPVNANPSARKEFVCTCAIDDTNIVFLVFRAFENETNVLRISSIPLDKKIAKEIAKEIEQRLPMQMLPTPILSLENNNWIVHNISTDATMIEFWDGSLVYQYRATNGMTAISTPAPTDGKIRNVAVRVTADGYHPSAFSNTVVYPNLNDVMTEFVKTRRSLSRVYFPFYSDFPYNDINNRVKLKSAGDLGTHRSLPITDNAQNVIVPAIDGAEKCLLLNGNDAGKQNRRLAFTRCEFFNNDSVTASNARPDEMVVDPFPRKECTIEMWVNSQTTKKGCLFASISREDDGGTPNFYDFYWDTSNGHRTIILNMQTEKPQTAGVREGIQVLQVGGVSQNDKGWFHLVFTQEIVNEETVTLLYVNGTLRERWTPIPLFHDCQTARAIYSVGAPCGDSGNCFDGVIHSFGIYDFVWNAAQVKAVYEAEKE